MSQHSAANDWEICIIASIGGAGGGAAGVFFADVRSVKAATRSAFLFIGGGFGFGGSMGSGAFPSPSDIVQNHQPDMYTKIPCKVRFSVDDLDCSSGQVTSLGVSAMYGYSIVRISAGMFPVLFNDVNCNGWGTGVGANGYSVMGVWKQLGDACQYGDDIVAVLDDVNYDDDEYQVWA